MRTSLRLFAVAGLLCLAASSQAQLSFYASLDSSQETHGVVSPASGWGMGTLTGGPGSYVFTYELHVGGLQGAIRDAHIHGLAPRGTNASVIHGLDNLSNLLTFTGGSLTGDWRFDDATRPLTDAFAQGLIAGNTYFNVHTAFSAAGEIRGQIQATPEPGTVALATGLLCLGGLALRRRK